MKCLLATLFVLAACAGPAPNPPPEPPPLPPVLNCPECPVQRFCPPPAALSPNTCGTFPRLGWMCMQEAGEPYND